MAGRMTQRRNTPDTSPLNNANMILAQLRPFAPLASLTAVGLVLAGCAIGPNYVRPSVTTPTAFKEAAGWTQAAPGDLSDRGDWWTLFNDPVLNDLEAKVVVNNQNLIAAQAAYRESIALLDQQRASLFPSVNATGSATQSKSAASTFASTTGTVLPSGVSTVNRPIKNYSLKLGASWDVDVWGNIRRAVESARDTAQASKADLANAKLSAQILLAVDYVQLRATDEQKRLIDDTVKAYADNLRIVNNKFNSGVAARSDVLTAQTQLKSAQASAVDLLRTRAQYEHAIAVTIGEAPADLTLQLKPWTLKEPPVPVGVPSTLLERRPDIAAAERSMAAANAQIGVAMGGYFPQLTLTGSDGFSAATLSRFFSAANNSWSFGASAVQTIFDAGLTSAKVRAARATYDQQVANYRQTVLTAFQGVEDNIAAIRVLDAEYALDAEASNEADEAEKITNNQYTAGTIDYTSVVVAQNTALSARRTLIQTDQSRMVAVVDLISALGGGWNDADLTQVKASPLLPNILIP